MQVSAYSLKANSFYSGQQSDCYYERYVSNDLIVTFPWVPAASWKYT